MTKRLFSKLLHAYLNKIKHSLPKLTEVNQGLIFKTHNKYKQQYYF